MSPWPTLPWQLWAGAAALFAALTAVLAKLGLQGIDANLATLVRTLVVAVALGLLLLATGQLQVPALQGLPRASLVALLLSGLATGASWLCYFQALQAGPVSRVASIDKLSVVLVALAGALVLGERLGVRAWIGVLLMGAGAVLVALP
jgi:transporter family protein